MTAPQQSPDARPEATTATPTPTPAPAAAPAPAATSTPTSTPTPAAAPAVAPTPAKTAGPAATAPPATESRTGPTTVLPTSGVRPPPPRPSGPRPSDSAASRPSARTRKARLAVKRVDPWSVFVFTLLASVFLGIALVVAVWALYTVLDGLGVLASVNELYDEVTGETGTALITAERVVGGAAVFAAANVVLLTLLSTLGALLYNLCASFTGGVELTLGQRDG